MTTVDARPALYTRTKRIVFLNHHPSLLEQIDDEVTWIGPNELVLRLHHDAAILSCAAVPDELHAAGVRRPNGELVFWTDGQRVAHLDVLDLWDQWAACANLTRGPAQEGLPGGTHEPYFVATRFMNLKDQPLMDRRTNARIILEGGAPPLEVMLHMRCRSA